MTQRPQAPSPLRLIRLALLALGLLQFGPTSADVPQQVRLAATDWCPYLCENSETYPGIAHEYLTQLLAAQGVQLEITFLPWSRAIASTNEGKFHGLATAVQSEAPLLRLTSSPMMFYRSCFFTGEKDRWRYSGVPSLDKIHLGAIKDYGYGAPLDRYIRESGQSNITLISGSEGLQRLRKMIRLARIDSFVEDPNVVYWAEKQAPSGPTQFRLAGCLGKNPFYTAVHPDLPWAAELIRLLDRSFQDPNSQPLLESIRNRYRP